MIIPVKPPAINNFVDSGFVPLSVLVFNKFLKNPKITNNYATYNGWINKGDPIPLKIDSKPSFMALEKFLIIPILIFYYYILILIVSKGYPIIMFRNPPKVPPIIS